MTREILKLGGGGVTYIHSDSVTKAMKKKEKEILATFQLKKHPHPQVGNSLRKPYERITWARRETKKLNQLLA